MLAASGGSDDTDADLDLPLETNRMAPRAKRFSPSSVRHRIGTR